jgi:hypothetical protein
MFPYDQAILAAVQNPPQTIPDVVAGLQTIDNLCVVEDGLKWFNWLYLAVTQAVENRVASGGFQDPAWLAQLDIEFARLYFSTVYAAITNANCPGCWAALFAVRNNVQIARIQFALAGMNAHINHDLCLAIEAASKATNTVPQHGTVQYNDYTSVNPVLDSLIDQAKQTLNVRLPGGQLPAVSHLADLIAAWDVSGARKCLAKCRTSVEPHAVVGGGADGHHRWLHRGNRQGSSCAGTVVLHFISSPTYSAAGLRNSHLYLRNGVLRRQGVFHTAVRRRHPHNRHAPDARARSHNFRKTGWRRYSSL